MGVGYQVSPLHRLTSLDTAALHQLPKRPIVRSESPLLNVLADLGVTVTDGPVPLRSPTVESILVWRQRLASKYRERLGEELTWDEQSSFENSEDVATSGDVAFYWVAAVLDRLGQAGLTSLVRRGPAGSDEMGTAFTEAERRGLDGRFPQLLMGVRIWLPFEKNLIIEEANWNGTTEGYGSVFRFLEQLTAVRAGIADADPSVPQYTGSYDPPEEVLASAWQTSATILRLAKIATEKRLPLLTTG